MKTFEEYLRDDVWEPEGILDDDMPDAFDDWMSYLDVQTVVDLADDYGKKMYQEGQNPLEGIK